MKTRFAIFTLSFLLTIQLFLNSCNSDAPEATSFPSDSLTLAKGQNSFLTNCSGCHNFRHNGIGPQLAGLTDTNSVDWIKGFISDPKKMIESGDERAQKLLKRYKTIMPSFGHLPGDEIDAIIAFIHTQKKQTRPKVAEDTNDIKNPIPEPVETSDLVVGLKLLTQIPKSSDQSPFTRIIKLDFQPNSRELFISDLRGKLYKLVNGQPSVYLDMAALKPNFITAPGINTGFGSFAFHPEFARNGLFYTTYAEHASSGKADFGYADTIPVALQWVLAEWKTDPAIFPFSGNGRELLRIDMPTTVHGVQEIAFNGQSKPGSEDYGMLYMGIGDGGSAIIGQPLVSPKPLSVWGSIIRIDPKGNNSRNKQYGIPPGNPFTNKNDEGYFPEVYAYGFRNPHRFNWDQSGRMLAVNIGEHHIESVNLVLPGKFYGWPIREGAFVERFFNETGKIYPVPSDDSLLHIVYPVAQYDHDEGTAISGGYEYTGSALPSLKGKYLFGDIPSGRLFYAVSKEMQLGKPARVKEWRVSMNGDITTLAKLCGNRRVELRFGKDSKGEMYILTKPDGKVYQLANSK